MELSSTPTRDVPDKMQTSLDVVLRCFVSALSADTGILLGLDTDGKPQLLSAAGYAARRATVPWTRGSFLGHALKAEGASLEPASGWREGSGSPDAWHAIACRISGPDEPLGVIYAGFDRPSHLSRGELTWAANAHARLAGLCMSEGGEAVGAVLRSSGVDQLTGCLRYERVLEMLTAEIQRSTRQGHALSCCFLDIDRFKAINEEHGHLQGDNVLASAGEALVGSARGFDCVGHFGGDEFVVVMPETSLPEARRAAIRMRRAMGASVTKSTGLDVATSAGVAQWRRGDSMLHLLEESDRALQADKASGDTHPAPLTKRKGSGGLSGLVRGVRSRVGPRERTDKPPPRP